MLTTSQITRWLWSFQLLLSRGVADIINVLDNDFSTLPTHQQVAPLLTVVIFTCHMFYKKSEACNVLLPRFVVFLQEDGDLLGFKSHVSIGTKVRLTWHGIYIN